MARTTNLSYEQIANAAEAINERGEKVTTRGVRAELGYGSMATILRFLQDWRNSTNQTGTAAETIDPSVLRAISAQIVSRVQVATDTAMNRNAELQSEIDALLLENEQQAKRIEEQDSDIESWKTDHAALSVRISEMKNTETRLTGELQTERQAGERSRIDLAKMESRLEVVPRLEAEIAQLRAELLLAQKEAANYHEIAAVAQARLAYFGAS